MLSDVDECASQGHGCGQLCINTAGSYHCACWDGFSLAADDKVCQPLVPAPEPETFSQAGNLAPVAGQLWLFGNCRENWDLCAASQGGWSRSGKGQAREQQPEPLLLFPVTKESLYHPNYVLSHKSSHCSICKGNRAHPQRAVAEMQLFSPSLSSSSRRASLEPRRAAGTAGDGPLLLLVRAVTLQTRTVSNNALWPARASCSKHLGEQSTFCTHPTTHLPLSRAFSRNEPLCLPWDSAESSAN